MALVPRPRALALPLALGLASTLACRDERPSARLEPMRTPTRALAPTPTDADSDAGSDGAGTGDETGGDSSGPKLAERPPADPAIDKALDLISSSGLRFVDQASDEDSQASEYTAEQFAAMLRTKWEWIGYDINELEPWLEAIAARSFKSNLPYQVVLGDGAIVELSGWLEQQLAASESP